MNIQHTQHTAGPWKTHRAFFYGHDSFQVTGTNGDSAPFLCRLTDDTPNYKENAALIAAAPDLLAALEIAHRSLVTCNSCHQIGALPTQAERIEIESATLQARAAIARALQQ